MARTDAQILRDAADRLDRSQHVRGSYAVGPTGHRTLTTDPEAVGYCMMGAVYAEMAVGAPGGGARDLAERVGFSFDAQTMFNDAAGTTKEMCVARLRELADVAERGSRAGG